MILSFNLFKIFTNKSTFLKTLGNGKRRNKGYVEV